MRPPYSAYDDRILGIMKDLEYSVVMWSYDSQDWQFASTEYPSDYNPEKVLGIVNDCLPAAQGSVIHIQHDNEFTKASVELVPAVIDTIRKAGFDFVTLRECLGGSLDVGP